MDCLKRERDISIKAMWSGGKIAARCNRACARSKNRFLFAFPARNGLPSEMKMKNRAKKTFMGSIYDEPIISYQLFNYF